MNIYLASYVVSLPCVNVNGDAVLIIALGASVTLPFTAVMGVGVWNIRTFLN